MDTINICMCLSMEEDGDLKSSEWEQNYQNILKLFLTFLYSHPKVPFSFYFTGKHLEFLQSAHPEAVEILGEIVGRKQGEVFGGGFYSPVFPLLLPADRSGQIEKMNAAIRTSIGKKPRGLILFKDIWDPSLIVTCQTCGIEYLILENNLIPLNKRCFLPIITSVQGKTLKILPSYKTLKPSADEKAGSWLGRIESLQQKSGIVPIVFSLKEIKIFLENGFFYSLWETIQKEEKPYINFTLPQIFLKNASSFINAYVPSGMDSSVAKWAQEPYKEKSSDEFSISIYDYLNTYPLVKKLYDRIMYISMLISQTHGADKMRKKSAQEKLWEAQSGFNFIRADSALPANEKNIQKAFSLLNEAEKLVRESKEFKESVTSYDYNADGFNEYICQMEKYHAVITQFGGSITELELVNGGGNFAANRPLIKTSGREKSYYARNIFVEHLFEKTDSTDFADFDTSTDCQFCNAKFSEIKFDAKRREIQLEASEFFSSLKMPVKLCKNYIISSNGFSVQYILKNESPFALKGIFAVETNFARTCFLAEQYEAEMIYKGNRTEIPLAETFTAEKDAETGGLSLLQIKDIPEKVLILFEPNEDSGFMIRNIKFADDADSSNLSSDGEILCSRFYWEVNLAPARAMEKTINVSIISAKIKGNL